MAIQRVAGHGVTSILGASGGQEAKPAPINFMPTQGPADYGAPKMRNGGGLPGGGSGGKKSSSPQAPNKSVNKILK